MEPKMDQKVIKTDNISNVMGNSLFAAIYNTLAMLTISKKTSFGSHFDIFFDTFLKTSEKFAKNQHKPSMFGILSQNDPNSYPKGLQKGAQNVTKI